MAKSRKHRVRSRQLGTLGDLPSIARPLEWIRREVMDMQTPAFWNHVWSEDK